MIVASIRPDDWNWLLMFHLLFAFALVGGVLAVTMISVAAVRPRADQALLLRTLAFRTNLAIVLPAFIGTRVFGEVLADREFGDAPGWLDAAFPLTDVGFVVGGILLTLLQWWIVRRTRSGRPSGWPSQVAAVVPPLVLALLVAVAFLMTGKPGGS